MIKNLLNNFTFRNWKCLECGTSWIGDHEALLMHLRTHMTHKEQKRELEKLLDAYDMNIENEEMEKFIKGFSYKGSMNKTCGKVLEEHMKTHMTHKKIDGKLLGLDGEWEIKSHLQDSILMERIPERSKFDKWAESRLPAEYDRGIAKVGFEKAIELLADNNGYECRNIVDHLKRFVGIK